MGRLWAVDTITINLSTELDFFDCSMAFVEIRFLKLRHLNNSNFWQF